MTLNKKGLSSLTSTTGPSNVRDLEPHLEWRYVCMLCLSQLQHAVKDDLKESHQRDANHSHYGWQRNKLDRTQNVVSFSTLFRDCLQLWLINPYLFFTFLRIQRKSKYKCNCWMSRYKNATHPLNTPKIPSDALDEWPCTVPAPQQGNGVWFDLRGLSRLEQSTPTIWPQSPTPQHQHYDEPLCSKGVLPLCPTMCG